MSVLCGLSDNLALLTRGIFLPDRYGYIIWALMRDDFPRRSLPMNDVGDQLFIRRSYRTVWYYTFVIEESLI